VGASSEVKIGFGGFNTLRLIKSKRADLEDLLTKGIHLHLLHGARRTTVKSVRYHKPNLVHLTHARSKDSTLNALYEFAVEVRAWSHHLATSSAKRITP